MSKDKTIDPVKATSEGRLYMDTKDFFKQEDIISTVRSLLKSDIIKQIEQRKETNKTAV
jgi:hypothetical protein